MAHDAAGRPLRDVDAAVTVAVVVVEAKPYGGDMGGADVAGALGCRRRSSVGRGEGSEKHRTAHCACPNCTDCETTGERE